MDFDDHVLRTVASFLDLRSLLAFDRLCKRTRSLLQESDDLFKALFLSAHPHEIAAVHLRVLSGVNSWRKLHQVRLVAGSIRVKVQHTLISKVDFDGVDVWSCMHRAFAIRGTKFESKDPAAALWQREADELNWCSNSFGLDLWEAMASGQHPMAFDLESIQWPVDACIGVRQFCGLDVSNLLVQFLRRHRSCFDMLTKLAATKGNAELMEILRSVGK